MESRRSHPVGSARLGPDDPAWSVAEELGRRLAEAACTVVSGGYGGLMAAVARSAREAGGHVVGLPMTAWKHLEPNEWNVELIWADGYPERLGELLACDAVVTLVGGVGTLSELAVAWSAAQTESDAPLLVAVGERWRRLLDALADELVASPQDVGLVHVVPSAEAAVELIVRPPERPAARARG